MANQGENPYSAKDAGCYVDSSRGIYAFDAIVEFAEKHGFDVGDDDPQNPLPESLADYEWAPEIEDNATDYMNQFFPVIDHSWGRNENGDWGLWSDHEYSFDNGI